MGNGQPTVHEQHTMSTEQHTKREQNTKINIQNMSWVLQSGTKMFSIASELRSVKANGSC